jgi:hypothetical protein
MIPPPVVFHAHGQAAAIFWKGLALTQRRVPTRLKSVGQPKNRSDMKTHQRPRCVTFKW